MNIKIKLLNMLLITVFFIILTSCQKSGYFINNQSSKLETLPNAAVYNIQLGLAYLKAGLRERAKQKIMKALRLAPNSAKANSAMGYYLESTHDFNKAKYFYRKSLLSDTNGENFNNYGAFLCRIGKYQEAEYYFLKAIRNINYINTAKAYENAGMCLAAIPNYKKARYYFLKALEDDPQRKPALYELVSMEYKLQHAKKALAYLKKYPIFFKDSEFLKLAIQVATTENDVLIKTKYLKALSKLRRNN